MFKTRCRTENWPETCKNSRWWCEKCFFLYTAAFTKKIHEGYQTTCVISFSFKVPNDVIKHETHLEEQNFTQEEKDALEEINI